MGLKLLLRRVRLFKINQLCNSKIQDFAMALRARKVLGAFEKRASVPLVG